MLTKFFDINETKKSMQENDVSTLYRSKYLLAHYQKLSSVERGLKQLPAKEEFYFLQTDKQFNAFTFIPFVVKRYRVKHLYAATYSISRRVIEALMELYDNGFIERITLCISDSLIRRNPVTVDLLSAMVSNRGNFKVQFTWSHAKVALLETDLYHYVIEGSGNWSENASYEQYLFANSRGLFEFRKELFENVEIRAVIDGDGVSRI